MKSYTEYLVFETKKRREMVHITDEVRRLCGGAGDFASGDTRFAQS
ncbi:MAG TPA: hypothetical protein VMU92_08530 [Acidobacteriaceae bacterium]|nr:hypothetical protein [Acidobacteriaceae bacterium]